MGATGSREQCSALRRERVLPDHCGQDYQVTEVAGRHLTAELSADFTPLWIVHIRSCMVYATLGMWLGFPCHSEVCEGETGGVPLRKVYQANRLGWAQCFNPANRGHWLFVLVTTVSPSATSSLLTPPHLPVSSAPPSSSLPSPPPPAPYPDLTTLPSYFNPGF